MAYSIKSAWFVVKNLRVRTLFRFKLAVAGERPGAGDAWSIILMDLMVLPTMRVWFTSDAHDY